MNIDTSRWTAEQHVSASIHPNGAVFFHAERGQVFTANHLGALVWAALELGQSPEQIATTFSSQYGVSVDAARGHIAQFIAQLAESRLIARRNA